MAAEDNNVDLEQIELLSPLADKQEEMRSKRIAFTTVEQTIFNSIMRLPPATQVTALRGFILRLERKLSEMSVQTVPAAQKETTAPGLTTGRAAVGGGDRGRGGGGDDVRAPGRGCGWPTGGGRA